MPLAHPPFHDPPPRHLAHLNVAHMRAPLNAPDMAGFVAELETLNRLADESPGFVWRMVDDDPQDPATLSLGPSMLVNLSVWTSPEALSNYVYRSAHGPVMRRRREWFIPQRQAYVALWWIPAGTVPTLAEAVSRLQHLRMHGASPEAFGFGHVSQTSDRFDLPRHSQT